MALINLNDTTPAAPAGFRNSKWQADAPGADRNVSNYQPNIGGVNAQTGTAYTLQASDNGKLITFSNGSPISFALPDASGFDAQFTFAVANLGAGTVTITPATSPSTCHIDGAASLAIGNGQGANIYSDGTDYFTERGVSPGGAGISVEVGGSIAYGPEPIINFIAGNAGITISTADDPANARVNVSLYGVSGKGVLGIVIDGAGSTPATGSKGFIQSPYAGTITGWTIIADQSGSAQITVKKATYSGFPSTTSIVASLPPVLTSAQKNTSTTLTSWTTAIALDDILEFNLDSVTTCTRIVLELAVTKT